ncbi:MAG: phosphomethylpyrimidine synthase ThiC [Terriglobia bacterium]
MSLVERLGSGERPQFMKAAAAVEGIAVDELIEKVVRGRAVVPLSQARPHVKPVAIGEGLSTKVNANIGTSGDYLDSSDELAKLRATAEAGAHTVMDLSTGGDLRQIREDILAESTLPVGTVPIYQAAVQAKREKGDLAAMTADELFAAIEEHARSGVDFVTVHTGVTRSVLNDMRETGRVTNIVSRGGTLLAGWMRHNDSENPLHEDFDRLLEIAHRYNTVLSLGDGLRPGCLADATDKAQLSELSVLADQVRRAREAGVQVIVEGPGHVPLHEIEKNVRLQKDLCDGAPFYVLGPLVTDIAPGYDHIVAAIGGSLAAFYGADFLCYVTPREHLGLPTMSDVTEGVIASRIAAHAADVAKGVKGAADLDLNMAQARAQLNWERQIDLSISPSRARTAHAERTSLEADVCTMCGELCALKLCDDYM